MSKAADGTGQAHLPTNGSATPRSTPVGTLGVSHRRGGLVALIALSSITCLYGLRSGPPLGDHECINAVAARQSFESGNWLVPEIDHVPWIRKTPLGIWLIGASSSLIGQPDGAAPVTELSARLPSALAGMANVLVVFWLGTMMYGHRGGLAAGFVCAGSIATILYSHNAQVDMVLTLFTTLSFACFWRGAMHPQPSKLHMAAFFLMFALSMLAKAPLPLAMVGLSLAAYWFVTVPVLAATEQGERRLGAIARRSIRDWRGPVSGLRRLWLLPGVFVFLVVVGAWPAYVYAHVDNALALWRVEYLARFTGGLSDRSKPIWYYIPIAFGFMMPFMASLPEAVAAPFLSRYAPQRRGLTFALTWAVIGTGFLSAAAFKRPHYLLSVVPAYCLLLAPVIDRLFFGVMSAATRLVRATCYSVPLLLAAGAIAGGFALQKEYPQLLPPYVFASTGALLVWTAACLTYARGRRTAAFVFSNLGVPILLLVMWPAASRAIKVNSESEALAAAFRKHGIGGDDEIISADRRPNASLAFYSDIQIHRLINENEIAGLRHDRRTVSELLLEESARRLKERLYEKAHRVFVIMPVKYYRMLSLRDDFSIHVVFRLDGYHDDTEDELVVVTGAPPA